jgi:signal transduction histidine kinase
MQNQTLFLKPFVAWVTDLTDKYRSNSIFKATLNIVTLQVALGILILLVTMEAIMYSRIHPLQSIFIVFCCLVLLIAVFGFFQVKFAITPARNSLQFQKRFIGNIAHELRTPLAIIKTTTEVALIDSRLSPDISQSFHDILLELDRISETINNLLSFDTLLQPNRMRFESVDITKIAENVLMRNKALAESRNISLSLVTGSTRMVLGNITALEQVITNLVKNAINYTPAQSDGRVKISIERDYRNWVVLAVIDTGIGIGQKDLYHIFEPYYRGDTSRARGIGTGSSGLGLAIVNEIVRLHKGTISVKSSVGSGTTIAISLPPAPEDVQSNTSTVETEEGMHEVLVDFS